MASIVFDTLAYANKLKAAGVPDKQAEVQAEALAQIVENNLATKQDIEELRRDMKEIEANLRRDIEALHVEMKASEANLRRDIEALRAELKRDTAEIKAEIIKWVVGLLFVQAAFIITMVKL